MPYYFSYSAKDLSPILKENLDINTYSLLYNKNKLHCTMLYSNDDYKEDYATLILPNITAKINQIDIWENNFCYIVARLEGQAVFDMHEQIKSKFNLLHQREFKPHITLQKASSLEEIVDVKSLEFLIGKEIPLINFECIDNFKNPKKNLKL